MGYSHYWYTYRPIEAGYFKNIKNDFHQRLMLEMRLFEPILFGADGTGAPLLSNRHISFNGDRHCSHQSVHSIHFCFPEREDKVTGHSLYGADISESRTRACSGGMCSCEAMTLLPDSDNC